MLMGHDRVDETELERALGRKTVAGEQMLQRTLASGKAWQSLRAAEGGRHGELDFRFCEECALAGDGKRCRFGDLAAATEGEAVDGGDHRLREALKPRRHRLAAPDELPGGDGRAGR